jgi:hypothetical protein
MLDIYKLQNQYTSLKIKTQALRSSTAPVKVEEAEGYELTEKSNPPSQSEVTVGSGSGLNEKVVAIKKEWRAWKLASIKNT